MTNSRFFTGLLTAAFALAMLGACTPQDSERSARTILVAGATGTQGGAVARELNARGYHVRGLTRDPESGALAYAAESQLVWDRHVPIGFDATWKRWLRPRWKPRC